MSIERAIRDWLIDETDGDTSQPERQTARLEIRQKVGNRIYLDRRPQSELDPAITIRDVAMIPFNDIGGEPDCTTTVLDLIVWGKQDGMKPIEIIELAKGPLHRAVAAYRGVMGSLWVSGVAFERGNMRPAIKPNDASDTWSFAYSMSYLFVHEQQAIVAL